MNKWVKKHKKICRVLNYIEHLLILILTVTGGVSISGLAYLVDIPLEIMSSAIGLKICETTAGFKTYKSIFKKLDQIVLLAKAKLSSAKVLYILIKKNYKKILIKKLKFIEVQEAPSSLL